MHSPLFLTHMLTLLLTLSTAHAATFYLSQSPSAQDIVGCGTTPAGACRSISYLFSNTVLTSGDTVLLDSGGDVHTPYVYACDSSALTGTLITTNLTLSSYQLSASNAAVPASVSPIIDCSTTGTAVRAFQYAPLLSITLSNLTFTNGFYAANVSNLTNYADGGGCLLISNPLSLLLHNVTFLKCSTLGYGGAVFISTTSSVGRTTTVSFDSCTFRDCTAIGGGAISYVQQETFLSGSGGSVLPTTAVDVTLQRSTFTSCSASFAVSKEYITPCIDVRWRVV